MNLTTPFSIDDGRYEVIEEIGRGAHAIVYRARDTKTGSDVAVKMLRVDVVSTDVVRRFAREIRITAQLRHPHIARVADSGEWNGRPFFVCELAEGSSLGSRIEREKQLPVQDAVTIAADVASALGFAHDTGVVHRDVKPDNILLASDGALIADFGIAHAASIAAEEALVTSTGIAVGTLLYMSPEQLCAERNIDGRSDQYSLALVLYEMLTGVRPHTSASVEGLRALRLAGKQHAPRDHRPLIPEHVNAAVMRALSPSPADRFRTCHEFAAALREATRATELSGTVAAEDAALARTSSGRSTKSRRGRSAFTVAAIAMLATALGAWNSSRNVSDRARADASAPLSVHVVATNATNEISVQLAPRLVAALSAFDGVEARLQPSLSPMNRRINAALGKPLLEIELAATSLGSDSSSISLVEWSGGDRRPLLTLRIANTSGLDSTQWRAISTRIVGGNAAVEDSSVGISKLAVPSRKSLVAYVAAWRALRSGALLESIQYFRVSGAAAQNFSMPPLWIAHLTLWTREQSQRIQKSELEQWRPLAENARREAAHASLADSLNAVGFEWLVNLDFVKSCNAYENASREEPKNFVSWFGLGECQRLDAIVVADTSSPTGWRFRSSHTGAVRAYTRALEHIPSPKLGVLFERVIPITYSTPQAPRHGRIATYDGLRVSAFPAAVDDTVVFWPIPSAEFAAGSARSMPASYNRALEIGKAQALRFSAAWSNAASQSFSALKGLAFTQEMTGVFGSGSNAFESPGALGSLRRALALAETKTESLSVAVSITSVNLRAGDFSRVRRVADSVLLARTVLSPAEAKIIAPLTALLGNGPRLEELIASEARGLLEDTDHLPDSLAKPYARLRSAVALQDCETLDREVPAFERRLRNYYANDQLPDKRRRWLTSYLSNAVGCLTSVVAHLDTVSLLDRAIVATGNGESARARAILDTLAAGRRGATLSAIPWDTQFRELWIMVQLGDSSQALRRAENSFGTLAGMSEHTLVQIEQAAGLRNSLQFCSRIAHAAGDASVKLWDPIITLMVDRNTPRKH